MESGPLNHMRHNAFKAVVMDDVELTRKRMGKAVNYFECKKGRTAIFYAKSEKMLDCLAELGADVNRRDKEGYTALHLAVRFEKHLVAPLIRLGADVSAADEIGVTPLHFSTGGNDPKSTMLLIEAGADVNAKNNSGRTPIEDSIRAWSGKRMEAADIVQTEIDRRSLQANLKQVLPQPIKKKAKAYI